MCVCVCGGGGGATAAARFARVYSILLNCHELMIHGSMWRLVEGFTFIRGWGDFGFGIWGFGGLGVCGVCGDLGVYGICGFRLYEAGG